ncbi:putative spermidine/putrescine transport system permease protein [Melghirimyces profundicolus]|uniref:Putative spermidine/putrescine transport system permease protein n=1 Tax=Melghirimyces profundicolus TaxID=1242148 RepID=A0A2T6C8S4_9BACL|nr:ABC transporter permease subunit [Melghirimyces profundicolus]PTX64721.1 putative spermidine/putrescine transport system permease protein [Melghirimyces profundicolus]
MSRRLFHRFHRVAVFLFILFIVVPFIPLLLWSVSAGWRWPHVLPESFSLRAWTYLFSPSSGLWESMGVSLQVAIVVTLINLLIAVPAANALARYRFWGKRGVEALMYAPLVVPPYVAIMGLHLTFIRWNVTETVAGVVLAHLVPTLPYMLRPLVISYRTLGFQWEDQARMLGASAWARFRHVVLPHLLPGIAAGVGLSLLVSLSEYLLTLLIGGGLIRTFPLLLFPFLNGGDPAIGAALSLVFAGMTAGLLITTEWLLRRCYGDSHRTQPF